MKMFMFLLCLAVSFTTLAEGGKQRLGYNYPTSDDITFANQLCAQAGLEVDSVTVECVDGEVCELVVRCE